jgi:hypothetical protein
MLANWVTGELVNPIWRWHSSNLTRPHLFLLLLFWHWDLNLGVGSHICWVGALTTLTTCVTPPALGSTS